MSTPNSARENLVTFEPVESLCPAQSDVTLRYTLGTEVTANPLDWVGIFKSGCRDIDNPITCQWAPVLQSDGAMTPERRVVFPAKFIQPLADQPNSYQFLYVSGSSHILGASQSFKVMDAGGRQQLVGVQTHCPVAEARDGHSTNQEATSYVNVSHELVFSDDEWELATHEELCMTNSSTSDLSDIEILSTSPSKEAVKMLASGAGDEDADDVCEFENIAATSLVVDDAIPDNCSNQRNVTAVSEMLPTSQYPSMLGVSESKREIVEVKRKLKRQSFIVGSEEEESNEAKNVIVKESWKAKKLKQSSIASRKTTKLLGKSKKIVNAPVSEVKLQIKNSQIVNSESSSDNEDYSSVLLNCNVRKRKRKNKTGKNKCHPAVHHNILASSESDPENHQQASIQKAKRRKTRTKEEESVARLCNQLSLRQQELFDCKAAEVIEKLNRIIDGDQMVDHTKREKEYDNSKITDQSIKMGSERWRSFDEDKKQVVTPCNLEVVRSPDKSKVVSRKTKKVDDSMNYQGTVCSAECDVSPHNMYSRKEIDENIKFEMISHCPHDMEYHKNMPVNCNIPRNSEENRKHQVIPFSLEDLISADRNMKYSGNVEEIRNYSAIPLSNDSLKYTEKTTTHSKLVGNDGPSINNAPPCKTKNLILGEETNYKKINIDENNKRRSIAKGNLEIVASMQQSPSNIKTIDDAHGRKRNDVSVCNLKAEKTRNNSKLTWVIDAKCFQDETVNNLKSVEFLKKKTNSKTSNNKLKATIGLSEQKMTEGLDASKQKLVSQITMSQTEETDCRMFKLSDGGCKRQHDGECGENRAELSGGSLWDISSKETMASAIPDDCVKTVRKKLRKDKTRRKKETSMKRQIIQSRDDGIDVMLSDRGQIKEIHQIDSQRIPVTEDAENLSANGPERPGSGSQTREMAERVLDVGRNDVVCAESGASCREKPTFGAIDGRMCFTDRGDLMASSSPVDGAPSSGHQVRKEKMSQSKIRSSQFKFKSKYKCQGRTSSRTPYFQRGDIYSWRKLCRLLVVNKRRFTAAVSPHDDDDDDGTHVELEITERSAERAVPEVSSRAGLCPQVADLTKSSAINGVSHASMGAENRRTYVSVVKGIKQDPCLLHKEGQGNTIIETPYEESYAIGQDSAKCLKKEREGITESEDISKPLCCDCVTNPEVSSMQEKHKFPGLTCERNPHPLTAGDEFTWDFQPRLFGKLSAGSVMGTVGCGSNTTEHTFIASNDISNVTMVAKTKENINAKFGRDGRVVDGNLGTAHKNHIADLGTEGDDVVLNWPLPSAVTRTSLLKEHPETGVGIPHKAEKRDSGHRIFAKQTQAVIVASTWLDDQSQTNTCPDILVEASISSKFELSPSQAGQMEVAELGAALDGPAFWQPPQTRDIPVTDESLTWPPPVTKSLSSKFGFGNVTEDQADISQINSDEFLLREDYTHRRPALRNSLDIPSFPGAIQSQCSINGSCGSPDPSEIKAELFISPKDENTELGYREARSHGESTDIKQRVDALDKLLEDLSSLLKQQRAQLQNGGDGDDVTASGCSRSGKVKSMKHKGVSILKSKGDLTKSSLGTVTVKPKVRIYKTRIAELENQMNILRETLMNTTRHPVKIHVKCKKLQVRIRDGKRAAKTGQASDGPVTVSWTQEDDEAQEPPTKGENDGLDQEVNTEDIAVNVFHSEVEDGVMRATPSQMGEHDLDHESTLRARSESITKSASDVEGDELMQVTTSTSPVQTDTSSMGYPSPVHDALAKVDCQGLRVGYRGVFPETLSNNYLQCIPSRLDESRVIHTSSSSVRNPDMFSDQTFSRLGKPDLIPKTPSTMENSGPTRTVLSNLGYPDPIPQTSSRAGISDKIQKSCSGEGESDQIRENYSRVGDRHLTVSHSVSNDEIEATRETVGTFAGLSNKQGGQLEESGHQEVSTQRPHVNAHQVSLTGMGDVPSLTSAAKDPTGTAHTQPSHDCSDCNCALYSCHAHAPTSRLHPSEPNHCSPASGVNPRRHQTLMMSTNISDDNFHCPAASSFDHHPLAFSRQDSIPHSPYSYFTSPEKMSRHKNNHEMSTPTLQPVISSWHHRAHAVCQNPQLSFSQGLHMYTPQSHETNKQAHYQQPWSEANPQQQHKLTKHNHDHDISWDHLREGSYPWSSITEGTFPKGCCWHSAHDVRHCICDGNHTLQMMATKNPTSSDTCYLSENQPCLYHCAVESKHGSHVSHFQPGVSRTHHTSRELFQGRCSSPTPRLTSRVEQTDSSVVDVDCPAFSGWSSPRKAVDSTTSKGQVIPKCSTNGTIQFPTPSKHDESHAPITLCSNNGRQSANPYVYSCRPTNQDNQQYRNENRIRSEKQFQKTLEHDIRHQYPHCQSPLCHQQEQALAFNYINSSSPFQDPHVLQNNHSFISQIPYTGQHPSIDIQNTPGPYSPLSNPYQYYFQEDAHNVKWGHVCLNSACISSLSPTEACEDSSPHHHHHLQHAGSTAARLNPTAETEYLPNHRNCCNCFCFTDGCMHRRQIEGSQSCLQQRSS